jgi:opacity protein-like surface antigen
MRTRVFLLIAALAVVPMSPAFAADDSQVKAATKQVETGAKKIGEGKVGEGVEDTAKGIGKTVVEGAKYTGEKLKESGRAAEPQAKSAWDNTKAGAISFGHSVKNFFTRLFSSGK